MRPPRLRHQSSSLLCQQNAAVASRQAEKPFGPASRQVLAITGIFFLKG